MTDSLLSVDVDAALRKLSSTQLASEALAPGELARCLFRSGADELRIRSGRKSVVMEAPGAVLAPRLLRSLATLWDRTRRAEDRLDALEHLEVQGALSWLALCSFGVEARGPSGTLSVFYGRAVYEQGGPTSTTVELRHKRNAQTVGLLRSRLAHSRKRVSIDGKVLETRPLSRAAFVYPIDSPKVSGAVFLEVSDDLGLEVVVEHEVVRSERRVPARDGIVCHAVVHCAPSPPKDALDEIVLEASARAFEAARDALEQGDPATKRRVLPLLLARAAEVGGAEALAQSFVAETAAGRWLRGRDFERRARWRWLAPDEDRVEPDPAVLSVDERCRAYLARIYGAEFEYGAAARWRVSGLRRLVARLSSAREQLQLRVRKLRRLEPQGRIEDDALTPGELQVLSAVRRALANGDFRLLGESLEGQWDVAVFEIAAHPLPPTATRTIPIARGHPAFRAAASLVDAEPELIYPFLVALFGGFDGWGRRKHNKMGCQDQKRFRGI